MANEFVARNGVIAQNNSTVSGSLIVTGGITGSLSGSVIGNLTGTASYASSVNSASYALTSSYAATASYAAAYLPIASTSSMSVLSASYALNTKPTFPYTGSAIISGSLTISGSAFATSLRGSGSGVLTVDGTSGRLFSVDDSLSGSLFSVNTVAGLPVIEAFSDNTVRIGKYGTKGFFVSQSSVGIGIESPTTNLHVSGSTGGIFKVDGAASINAIYVSASGNVGIGTTTPNSLLHISGPTPYVYIDDTSTTGTLKRFQIIPGDLGTTQTVGFGFDNLTGSASTTVVSINELGNIGMGIGVTIPSSRLHVSASSGIVLKVDGSSLNNIMYVSSSGFVGLGTTSDFGDKLSVAGNIRASSGYFTGGGTNIGVIQSSGYSVTAANAISMVAFDGTWNTTGNPTAILLNITNTASGATSKLIDLQIGSATKFNVNKSGQLALGGYTAASSFSATTAVGHLGFDSSGNIITVAAPSGAVVATAQTTSLATYGDLTTVGPAATVTVGTSGTCIVILTAIAMTATSGVEAHMGFAVSGATTVAASDAQSLASATRNAGDLPKTSAVFWVTGLSAGSNTFTSKYRSGTAGTVATFTDRNIIVIPI